MFNSDSLIYVRYVPYPKMDDPDYFTLGANPTKGITKLREDRLYRVLNINDYLNESEMFFAISTDEGAICMYSNRHFRLETILDKRMFLENLIGRKFVIPSVIKVNDWEDLTESYLVSKDNWLF